MPEPAAVAAAHRKVRTKAGAAKAAPHAVSHTAGAHPSGHEAWLVAAELRRTGIEPAHVRFPLEPRLPAHHLFRMTLDDPLRTMVDSPARRAVAFQVLGRLHLAGGVARQRLADIAAVGTDMHRRRHRDDLGRAVAQRCAGITVTLAESAARL